VAGVPSCFLAPEAGGAFGGGGARFDGVSCGRGRGIVRGGVVGGGAGEGKRKAGEGVRVGVGCRVVGVVIVIVIVIVVAVVVVVGLVRSSRKGGCGRGRG